MALLNQLKHSLPLLATLITGMLAVSGADAQPAMPENTAEEPIRIIMGGYGPATTGFSIALKEIGDRLESKFGDRVEVRYVYNIMDLGYQGQQILSLVEDGVLTLGYQSSSYMTACPSSASPICRFCSPTPRRRALRWTVVSASSWPKPSKPT